MLPVTLTIHHAYKKVQLQREVLKKIALIQVAEITLLKQRLRNQCLSCGHILILTQLLAASHPA